MAAMNYLPGKFVWFEHVSNDLVKARAFYEPLFNWHVERMTIGDQTYHMVMAGNGGIGGLRQAETPATKSHWASYLSVLDVDRSYAEALAAGAKRVMQPINYGAVGRGATITDPTGAEVCLWTGMEGDMPDPDDIPFGHWGWNELWTSDVNKAVAFYEKVFGYTHDTMQFDLLGSYVILKTGEKMRAGITQSTDPKATPMWLPYVRVEDCDDTLARALKLGAKKLLSPTDLQHVGRFSILQDPLGAAIAIIKTTPKA
jgi:uncharacterized protein